MIHLDSVHHVAVICSDYQVSKQFYTDVLGFQVISEVYRKERQSYKLDLKVSDDFQIELFSFPDSPARPSYPEAAGLRHIAFRTSDIDASVRALADKGVVTEPVRIDEFTGKRFTFFEDPDHLPIELYER